MSLPWRDTTGVYHPRDEAEVVSLVRWARATGRQVRARGARHSLPGAIHTDAHLAGAADGVELALDRLAEVLRWDDDARTVTVGGGCRIGADPRDVTGLAFFERSLTAQLDARGWALPDLGGVVHQTVAGFLATGCAGGSVQHAFQDAVLALRLVDGTGRVLALRRGEPLFDAALVSLGLLGVVTEVTFQCVPRYDVVGDEACRPVADAPVDLFDDGPRGLAAAMARETHLRFMWWAQPGVDRLVTWRARPATDAGPTVPYVQMPPMLGSSRLTLWLAGKALGATAWWRDRRLMPRAGPPTGFDRFVEERVFPPLYREFVPVDEKPRPFRDAWHRALPLDDEMDERLMPVTFTELYVPVAKAAEAARRIRDLVARDGLRAAGTFTIEIYAAKASPAWLSPAYGGDQARFDLFWTPRAGIDPSTTWFPQFWAIFADLGVRPHWAKHMPVDPVALRAAYPRFDDFLRTRAELDPDGVFLTRYWARHLGIQAPARVVSGSVPANAVEPQLPSFRLPLAFALKPTDASFAARAKFRFDHTAVVPAPPEAVDETLWRIHRGGEWYPYFLGVDWPAGPPNTVGGVLDVSLSILRLRARVVEAEPGRRFVASIDRCSMPLATEMLEDITFTPRTDGGTDLRWIVYYDPLPLLAPFHPLIRPIFDDLFRRAARNLGTWYARNSARAAS